MTARNVYAMRRVELDHCQVRACRSSTQLHRHHVVPRSLTQNDDPENLVVLCAEHHAAVHDHTFDLGAILTASQGAKAVLLTGTVHAAHRLLYPSENPKVAA